MHHPPLGPYDLHEPIGHGGMGTVYLGINRDTGRKVAVKVLAPNFASDPGFRERFEAEIQSLVRLKHPNIVEIYGYGEQEGVLYYAMELVPGANLQQELSEGRRFQWREVVQIGIQICSALKHAHDHGIIHRDIKPANLILTEEEQIKLTDFGIAKLFGNTQITVDGGVLGTADYMAPEQAEGIGATSRTDLYSLGGLLYCLLAGRPPFQGKSIAEVIHKVRYDSPVPIRRLAEDTPKELEHILSQLLSKKPESRVPTARALANRLSAIQHALSVTDEPLEGGVLPMDPAAATIHNSPQADLSEEEFAVLETVVESSQRTDDRVEPPTPLSSNPAAVKPSFKSSSMADAVIAEKRTHFTTVDENHRQQRWLPPEEPDEPLWARMAAVACLVTLLGLIAVAIWYFRRPPTADQLFAQIHAAAQESDEALMRNDNIVATFLKRFPNDSRKDQVEEYEEDIELERLQRQLETAARLRNASRSLAPVEHALVEAIRQEILNPITAKQNLEAIINVFSTDPDATDRERQCIRLAERNRRRLDRDIRRNADTYVNVLRARLEYAAKLRSSDPETARLILLGIVELYDSKPWANEVVQTARQILRKPLPGDDSPSS